MVSDWFRRTGAIREKPPFEDLEAEVLAAGSDLISRRRVRLPRSLKDKNSVPTGFCPACRESYPLRQGPTCLACQGHAYYDMHEESS